MLKTEHIKNFEANHNKQKTGGTKKMNRIRIMKEIKRLAVNNEHFYNWYSQLSGLEIKYYDLFDEIMNCLEKMNFCFRSELIDFFRPINRTVELYTKCKMAV